MTLFKIKIFHSSKDNIETKKDKLKTSRKYLPITYPTKDLNVKYIKNSQNLTIRKQKSHFLKWAKGLPVICPPYIFTTEDTCNANKHTERWSTSLVIRKIQIKVTIPCRYRPIRTAKINKHKA